MNINNQINMTNRVQANFSRFLLRYRNHLTLPAYKALRDLCQGILASGSVIVNQMAVQLNEKTSLKKTAERLYRNLKHDDFADTLSTLHIQKQCRYFDESTLILVDESDIVKPQSQKMQGLHQVWDGSKSRYDQKGYALLNIIGYRKQKTGYQIYPLCSDLFSPSMEMESMTNLLHDRLDEITVCSGNRGVFIFDRGYDSRVNLHHLVENENSFIIRGVGKRNLVIQDKERNFRQVCLSVPLCYRHPGKTKDAWFDCGIKRVKIRTNGYQRKKNMDTVELWLVVARYASFHEKGYFYFFCDFPHSNLNEADIIHQTLTYYKLRWKIEQAHRQLKQDYKWESMQLMSYIGLRNLNMVLWIAVSFLYTCKEQILLWAEAFPRHFDQYRKSKRKLYEFVYTALSKAVRIVFQFWPEYQHNRHIVTTNLVSVNTS